MTAVTEEAIAFPSVAWFEEIARQVNESADEFRKIGEIDCSVAVCLLDGAPDGGSWQVRLDFEEVSIRSVCEIESAALDTVDFVLETDLQTWLEMVQNIRDGGGRPDLDHTLNRLSLPGTPIRVWSSDPLGRDMFFRFNQTIQRTINKCPSFATQCDRR